MTNPSNSIFEFRDDDSPLGNWTQQQEQNQRQAEHLRRLQRQEEAHLQRVYRGGNSQDPLLNDVKPEEAKEEAGILGGEVTNESDRSWLISGGSNSNVNDFLWLHPNTNSDDVSYVDTQLDGDVDAVWPNGVEIKNYYTNEIVTTGAFKLRDHRNTNIIGNAEEGYTIYDFSFYFTPDQLPAGWSLPEVLVPFER